MWVVVVRVVADVCHGWYLLMLLRVGVVVVCCVWFAVDCY